MKVLIITIKNPFLAKDGGSLAILNILEGYRNLGYDITLLMMNTLRHYIPREKFQGKINQYNIKVIDFTFDNNIKIINALKNLLLSKMPYNLERFYSEDFEKEIAKILSEEKFDFIQLESSFSGLYLDIIKQNTQAPIFLRSHNVEYEIWERNASVQSNFLKKIYFGILAKRFKKWEEGTFPKYDAIFPMTLRDKAKIQKVYQKSNFYFTLPYTINIKEYPFEEITLTDLSIAYLGVLDWIPNQEGLLWFLKNVWSRIYNYYPGLKFYIAGRNAPDWLIKRIKSYKVEFLGEVPSAREFILQHPIFVVPLLSGSGMRIKIIEQMALGRVVISTPIGAEGIDISSMENGILAEQPNDFISNIDYLFRNPDGIRYISKNARLTIENLFDSSEIFYDLNEFILKILNNRQN